MSEFTSNLVQNNNKTVTDLEQIIVSKTKKKTTKKVNYSVLKDFEIETELLNKILTLQARENKKNILSGGKELTIKELINSYLRTGLGL